MTTKPMTIEEVLKEYLAVLEEASKIKDDRKAGELVRNWIAATLKEFGEYVAGEDDIFNADAYFSDSGFEVLKIQTRNALRKQQRARIATFFEGKEVK